MKSGPGRSTIELGAKASVIEPPLPSVTTSNEPLTAPAPLGAPSTTSGNLDWPKVGPGPAMNDWTEVAKLDGQDCSPSFSALSVPAELQAEQKNTTEKRAPHARSHKLTNVDSRASSRSVVGRYRGDFRVAPARLQTGLPTSLSSACHLREHRGFPTFTGFLARGYSGYGGGSVPDFHRTSQGGISTSPRGAR